MEGVPYPVPIPLIFQASGGPSLGHCWRRPRSLEAAFRSGPCHWGQSKLAAKSACCAQIVSATKQAENRVFMLMSNLVILVVRGKDLRATNAECKSGEQGIIHHLPC